VGLGFGASIQRCCERWCAVHDSVLAEQDDLAEAARHR
jgi:hypothetical protein